MSIEPPLATIGRYRIVRLLGRGGMGEVYLARDPVLERDVALKLIGGEIDDKPARERMIREARAAGRLQHANIVTVFDAGEHDGRPFIAMEYVSGETIGDLIRRRAPLSLPMRLKLIESACEGLAYAHRAGIIHLDVKPDNLILDEAGIVKVLDFGISRVLQSESHHTRHLAGTLRYMSPEQLQGRPLDRRSDIFSLGCAFYEVIAYVPAFTGSAQEIVTRIAAGPVPNLRAVLPDVHPGIARAVSRAMALDPSDRYDDLDNLRAEIGRLRSELEPDGGAGVRQSAAVSPDDSTTLQILPQDLASRSTRLPATADGAAPSSRLTVLLGVSAALAIAAVAGLWMYRIGSPAPNTSTVPANAPVSQSQPALTREPEPGRPAQQPNQGDDVWRRLAVGDRNGVLRLLRSSDAAGQNARTANDVLEAVRSTVVQARQAAARSRPSSQSSPSFKAAEARLERANRLRADNRPIDALPLLWEASDLFAQAGAADQPPPALPPIARQATVPTESPSPSERAAVPANDPPAEIAASKPVTPATTEATSPPRVPTTPAEPAPQRSDHDLIADALDRYVAAYRALDASAVQRVLPFFSIDELEKIRQAFEGVTIYEMDLQNERVDIRGDVATVQALVVSRQVPKVGRPVTNSVQMRFQLRREGALWIITGLDARR